MTDINQIAEDVILKSQQKMARDALNGVIGLIYATHELSVAKEIIKSASEEALNY